MSRRRKVIAFCGSPNRIGSMIATGTTFFAYDGANPVAEPSYNASTTTTTVTAYNTFGANGLLSRRNANVTTGVTTYYTFDPNNVAERIMSQGADSHEDQDGIVNQLVIAYGFVKTMDTAENSED